MCVAICVQLCAVCCCCVGAGVRAMRCREREVEALGVGWGECARVSATRAGFCVRWWCVVLGAIEASA